MNLESEILEKLIAVTEVKEAYKLHQSGFTYEQIAEEMDISES